MGVYPPGSTVQLTDDRYATRPRRQFGAAAEAERARPRPGDAARGGAGARPGEAPVGLGIRRSISAQQLPPTALDYLAPSRAHRLLLRAVGTRTNRRNEQSPAGRPVQRRRGGAAHLAGTDRGDARGGLPGRARGAAHRRRQRRRPAGCSACRRPIWSAATCTRPRRRPRTSRSGSASARRRQRHILSDSFVTRAGGQAVPVTRRVSRIEPAPGTALYVLALLDRSEQSGPGRSAASSRRSCGDAGIGRRRRPGHRPRRPHQPLQPALCRPLGAARRDAPAARRRRGVRLDAAAASPSRATTCAGWPRSMTRRCCGDRPVRAALGRG